MFAEYYCMFGDRCKNLHVEEEYTDPEYISMLKGFEKVLKENNAEIKTMKRELETSNN